MSRRIARRPVAWLAWLLPLAAVSYLLAVHAPRGWFGVPYWACLAGPTAVVLATWVLAAALRGDRASGMGPVRGPGPWLVVAAAVTIVTLVALAWPLGWVPHANVRRLVQAGLLLAGIVAAGLGAFLGWRTRRAPGALEVLVVIVVAAMVETDVAFTSFGADRDFNTILLAGQHFLRGQAVYTETPFTRPFSPGVQPFVYLPLTLPPIAVLASLPVVVAKALWFAAGLGAAVAAMRLFGVQWRWVPVLLLWPPFALGLWVGNADIPALIFFAAAPWVGAFLVVPPLVKLQLGATGLWLLRERRWRSVSLAALFLLLAFLVTLPLVSGLGAWASWLRGLQAFAATAEYNPAVKGVALTRYLPPAAAIAIALIALLVALRHRGRDGLASLGLASLCASPTLYLHGLTLGLPGLLRLRGAVLWVALTVTSTGYFQQAWWIAVALGFAAPFLPRLGPGGGREAGIHPLGESGRIWPRAPLEPPSGTPERSDR